MAKRKSGGMQTATTANTTKAQKQPAPSAPKQPAASVTADAMEQRVIAFAEQLGRIAGTVQAKTEGWMDRETLNKQIASVRDSAAELLEHLSNGVSSMTGTATKTVRAASSAASHGRSGGVVDAPGKKHRKPMPADPRTVAADARRANMRSSRASMKTTKRRGRG